MGTLRFFEEVVSFKIRRTFGFADYILPNRRSLNNFLYIYVELFYWTNCF